MSPFFFFLVLLLFVSLLCSLFILQQKTAIRHEKVGTVPNFPSPAVYRTDRSMTMTSLDPHFQLFYSLSYSFQIFNMPFTIIYFFILAARMFTGSSAHVERCSTNGRIPESDLGLSSLATRQDGHGHWSRNWYAHHRISKLITSLLLQSSC